VVDGNSDRVHLALEVEVDGSTPKIPQNPKWVADT
jgi:hypothetical protein